jgi:hypothetical protein
MTPLEALTSADFDAFEQGKWGSNAFNLERLEVKLKLTAFGKRLAQQAGEPLAGLEMGITAERPSIFNQHRVRDMTVYFHRDQEARRQLDAVLERSMSIADKVQDPAPHHKHLVLGVRVEQTGVLAGMLLHRDAWVDWKNVVERCRAYGEAGRLESILAELPPEVRYARGESLPEDAPAACELDGTTLTEGFELAKPWTLLVRRWRRDEAALGPDALVAGCAEVFAALTPLYTFAAWSRQNDHCDLSAVLEQEKEKVQRRFRDLKVGDEVRILSGLAAGRIGVVDAVERRGVVKVRLGLMVMAVQMGDLAPP